METPDLMMLLRLVRHRGWIDEDRLESWIAEFPGGLTVEGVFGRLVAAGTINSAEADAALTHLRNRARGLRDSSRERLQRDRSFGRIALDRGWIDGSQLEHALLEQARLRRLRLDFRVGEVLVRQGALVTAQVREILGAQGLALDTCRGCAAILERGAGEPPADRCPNCGGELRPSLFLDPVPADDIPIEE